MKGLEEISVISVISSVSIVKEVTYVGAGPLWYV